MEHGRREQRDPGKYEQDAREHYIERREQYENGKRHERGDTDLRQIFAEPDF